MILASLENDSKISTLIMNQLRHGLCGKESNYSKHLQPIRKLFGAFIKLNRSATGRIKRYRFRLLPFYKSLRFHQEKAKLLPLNEQQQQKEHS
ncbi:MAG: hypothetical protein WD512_07245, partial [Candidatus Paceibacterota bacterium]